MGAAHIVIDLRSAEIRTGHPEIHRVRARDDPHVPGAIGAKPAPPPVAMMTASQSAQLGYALDSRFYGTSEYTKYMRDGLAKLTLADVNAALKRHLSAGNLRIVCVTKDAEGLKQALDADAPSSMTYESKKPQELLDEDKLIGARKLGIAPENVRILPVEQVFAK